MTFTLKRWISREIEDRGLNGYAREVAEEALQSDPTIAALYKASKETDDRQSRRRREKETFKQDDLCDTLTETRRACDRALDELAEQVVEDAVSSVEMHGFTVDLRHSMRIECPACEEERVSAFYLGGSEDGEGFVCGHCGAELLQDLPSGEIEAITEGSE